MAHEYEEPKNYLIVIVGVGSMVTLIAIMFGLFSYYQILRDHEQLVKVGARQDVRLLALRKTEDHNLTTYAKLDTAGRVRIPIATAMDLFAKKGRDGVASIHPDPAALAAPAPWAPPAPPAPAAPSPAPMAPGSGAPAASGSAAPVGSAPAPR